MPAYQKHSEAYFVQTNKINNFLRYFFIITAFKFLNKYGTNPEQLNCHKKKKIYF